MALYIEPTPNNASSWILSNLTEQVPHVNNIVIRDTTSVFTYEVLLSAKRSPYDITLEVTNYTALAAILRVPAQARMLERLLGFNILFLGTDSDSFNELLELLHPTIPVPAITFEPPTPDTAPLSRIPEDTFLYLDVFTSRPQHVFTNSAHVPMFQTATQTVTFTPNSYLFFAAPLILHTSLVGISLFLKVRFSPALDPLKIETVADIGPLAILRQGGKLYARFNATQLLLPNVILKPGKKDYTITVRYFPTSGGTLEVIVNGVQTLSTISPLDEALQTQKWLTVGPFTGTIYAAFAYDRAVVNKELAQIIKALDAFPKPALRVLKEHRHRVEAITIKNMALVEDITSYTNVRTIEVINDTVINPMRNYMRTVYASTTDYINGIVNPATPVFTVNFPPTVSTVRLRDAPGLLGAVTIQTSVDEYTCGLRAFVAFAGNALVKSFVINDSDAVTPTIDSLKSAMLTTDAGITIAELKSEVFWTALVDGLKGTALSLPQKVVFATPKYIPFFLELYLAIDLIEKDFPMTPEDIVDFIRADYAQNAKSSFVDTFIGTHLASNTIILEPLSPLPVEYIAWYINHPTGYVAGLTIFNDMIAAVLRRSIAPLTSVVFNTPPLKLPDGRSLTDYETACIAFYEQPTNPEGPDGIPWISTTSRDIRFVSQKLDLNALGFIEPSIVPLATGMLVTLQNNGYDVVQSYMSITSDTDVQDILNADTAKEVLQFTPTNSFHLVYLNSALQIQWAFTLYGAILSKCTADTVDDTVIVCGTRDIYNSTIVTKEIFVVDDYTIFSIHDERLLIIGTEEADAPRFQRIDGIWAAEDIDNENAAAVPVIPLTEHGIICKLSPSDASIIWQCDIIGYGVVTSMCSASNASSASIDGTNLCYALYKDAGTFDAIRDTKGQTRPTASIMAFDSSEGVYLWGANVLGAAYDLRMVSADTEANAIVVGTYSDTLSLQNENGNNAANIIDPIQTDKTVGTTATVANIYIAKYSPQGYLWYALTLKNFVTSSSSSVIPCSDGGIIISGWKPIELLSEDVIIRNTYNEPILDVRGLSIALFIKLNQYGEIDWYVTAQGGLVTNTAVTETHDKGLVLTGTIGSHSLNVRQSSVSEVRRGEVFVVEPYKHYEIGVLAVYERFSYIAVPRFQMFAVERSKYYDIGKETDINDVVYSGTVTDSKGAVKTVNGTFYVKVDGDGAF